MTFGTSSLNGIISEIVHGGPSKEVILRMLTNNGDNESKNSWEFIIAIQNHILTEITEYKFFITDQKQFLLELFEIFNVLMSHKDCTKHLKDNKMALGNKSDVPAFDKVVYSKTELEF